MTNEMPTMRGCDELRAWLLEQGFKCAIDSMSRDNDCNWYAFRRSAIPAQECECNEGKPMQLVVRPFSFTRETQTWESAEVDVTGEANSVWFKLSAYGLKHDELRERLPEVEASLIAAWNALGRLNTTLPVAA